MSATVAVSLSPEEVSELDELRREHGTSRAEVLRDALRWYARWGEMLPIDDPAGADFEP